MTNPNDSYIAEVASYHVKECELCGCALTASGSYWHGAQHYSG